MIEINNLIKSEPISLFEKLYKKAHNKNQLAIQAACLSTNSSKNRIRSRFINIKYIKDNNFIFFTNYESDKANEIDLNPNVALNFYWNSIDVQVRIEGNITKTSESFSDEHWKKRTKAKNALALSSNQSKKIKSYDLVIKSHSDALKQENILNRPYYWGGYELKANYYEFWEGHVSRINKRKVYKIKDNEWQNYILQP